MLSALIVEVENGNFSSLSLCISHYFPDIQINACASCLDEASNLIKTTQPDLVFFDTVLLEGMEPGALHRLTGCPFEWIFISTARNKALDAFQHAAAGFVLRPVQVKDLLIAVNNVKKRIADKRENQHNGQLPRKIDSTSMVRQEIIGIPTMEGFEFLPVQEIIRCEALQKCTRVFTEARKEVFSSYNLGEFRKQLTAWGFFSPHKSHLINLRHVRKYHREGSIIMVDGSYVPVAKRKKGEFLNQVNHL